MDENNPIRLTILEEFSKLPRKAVQLPRVTANGKPYIIPSWCGNGPDDHMCAWGCMSVLHNRINGRMDCSGCEYSVQTIQNGKIVNRDGEKAFNRHWRWHNIEALRENLKSSYCSESSKDYYYIDYRERIIWDLKHWESIYLHPSLAPTVKVEDVSERLKNGTKDQIRSTLNFLILLSIRKRRNDRRHSKSSRFRNYRSRYTGASGWFNFRLL